MNISHKIYIFLLSLCCFACSKTDITPTFDRFYFRHDGADLAVQVDGNRASKAFILVLHGGPGGGSAAYNSGTYADQLEAKYAMVYMDQRGQGASQGKYNKSTVTLQQNSDDIYALTKVLKQKYGADISIFLMGHSWGGLTGTHALLRTDLQQELKGWIEANGAHDYPFNDIATIKMFQEIGGEELAKGNEAEFWEELLGEVATYDTTNLSDAESLYLNQKAFEAEEMIEEVYPADSLGSFGYGLLNSPDISMNAGLSNLLSASILNDESSKTPLTDELHKIQIPSILLWGKYDFVVPPALGVSAMELIGSSDKELIIFEHSGHSPMSNEPDLFVAEIEDFVERLK